jgi:hypothetical protein
MKRVLTFSLFLLVLSLLPIMNSCGKDQPQDHLIDVSFNINSSPAERGIKLTPTESIVCSDLEADYVKVIIDGEEYILNVFYIGKMPYTNTIKLPSGNYTISEVLVYSDNNNSNSDDDIVIAATPHSGSDFSRYVQHPLSYVFTVSGFSKLGLPIEVVCYAPKDYNHFGFTYF